MIKWFLLKIYDLYFTPTIEGYKLHIKDLEDINKQLLEKIDIMSDKIKETKRQNLLFINELKRQKRKEIMDLKPTDSVFDNKRVDTMMLDSINTINSVIKKANDKK